MNFLTKLVNGFMEQVPHLSDTFFRIVQMLIAISWLGYAKSKTNDAVLDILEKIGFYCLLFYLAYLLCQLAFKYQPKLNTKYESLNLFFNAHISLIVLISILFICGSIYKLAKLLVDMNVYS